MRPLIFFTCFVVRGGVKSCRGVEKRVEIRTFCTKGLVLQNRVPWGASVSAAKSGLSEPKAGAAVEIRRAKGRKSEFRAPQTGESFCPCQRNKHGNGSACFFCIVWIIEDMCQIVSEARMNLLNIKLFCVIVSK